MILMIYQKFIEIASFIDCLSTS